MKLRIRERISRQILPQCHLLLRVPSGFNQVPASATSRPALLRIYICPISPRPSSRYAPALPSRVSSKKNTCKDLCKDPDHRSALILYYPHLSSSILDLILDLSRPLPHPPTIELAPRPTRRHLNSLSSAASRR